MGQNSFITDADTALVNFIWNCIKSEPSMKNIISSQDQISLTSPNAPPTKANVRLSIFLYNINQETITKNFPLKADLPGKTLTQPPFVLHYLVTPLTGNDKDDHTVLENIIHTFLTTPDIGPDEGKNPLTTKIDSLSLHELSRIWIALDTPLRLSVSLTVSSVEIQTSSQTQTITIAKTTQTSPLLAKEVLQLYQNVLKTFTEQSEGWKSRNLVLKQWVLQDFKKNTDRTTDEMLIALNKLGDSIKQNEPTNEFVKPLNQLAIFYQHQFDQLKELRKVSTKQRENLETINVWIEDVKSLMKSLSGEQTRARNN